MFGSNRSTSVFIGLVGVLAAAGHAADRIGLLGDRSPAAIQLLLPLAMVSLSGLLLLGRIEGQRAMVITATHLRRLAGGGALAPAAAPESGVMRGVLGPLNAVLDRCRQEVQEMRNETGQHQIQSRVVAAERRRLEAILQAIPDAVLVINSYDELMLANPVARRLFRLPENGSARCPVDKVISDPRLLEQIHEIRSHSSRPRPRGVEYIARVDGQERTFQAAMQSFEDGGDEVSGVIILLADVTREKEIARMRTEFVSTVSHELRAPLAGIKAYVEMLLEGENNAKTQREFHQIIAGETDRLSRLIDNILNISRIEAGVIKVVKRPVDLTGIVKEVLEVISPQAKSRGLRIVERLAPVFAQVDGDRDMLSQVVTNLLSNAVKYTRDGGRVTISTAVDEARGVACLGVEDTGVGISPEDQKRVFEKFYRVRKDSQMAPGTGLGLSLVKHIVEDVHGGTISLASELGKGSTFSVELPLVR